VPFKESYYPIYQKFANKNFEPVPAWCNRKAFKEAFPCIMEFYIGEKDKFIYATKVFNPNGKLLGEMSFRDVSINPSIKDSEFDLPPNMTIQPVYSRKESIEVLSKNTEQAVPEYIKNNSHSSAKQTNTNYININTLSEKFWDNSNLISYFLAGFAIVILAIVIVVKVKK
jgi:hypothetical protein